MMDAWDNDDLDLGDDDDSTESYEESTPATIQMGQGFLVGRLSRFIDAVTQPEEEPERSLGLDAGGRDDDDDDDGLDELVEDEHQNDGDGWEQEDVLVEDSPPPPAAPVQESSGWDDELDGLDDESLHEESQLLSDEPPVAESGWDDELEGLDDSSLHEESHIQAEGQQNSGWGDDDALEGLDDSFQADPVTETAAAEESGGGWNDDGLEGLDEEPALVAETIPPPPPPTEEGGWGDDDDLDGLDEGDDFQGPTSSLRQDVVDHVPTLRSPVRTESMMTNADESTVLRENARDEEEFETSDDYGPVVDQLPSEHSQDHAARTASTLVPESCTEAMKEENRAEIKLAADSDPYNIIDHVPDDVSNVSIGNDDSNASVDGDEPSDMPMQENAEEGDTADGEFGPVVDRMPSDQNLPHAARTVSAVVPSSLNESLDEESDLETRKSQPLEVDHVPDDIEDVSTKNDDSTATVDGDEPSDLRDEQSNIEAAVAEVDHVPDDVSIVSTENDDSTATVDGDEPSDMPVQEEAEEGDTTNGDFGPVVDQMPSPHSSEHPDGTVSAVAPLSVNDEINEDDNEGEADGSTSAQAVASIQRTLGLVDHVPEDGSRSTNRNSMLAAATEMSVASELSNTLGDEALESDIDAKEENYGPMVDHTPLQQSVHSRRNPSVRVQAPLEEIDEDDDDEEQYFGPVVDHTPTVQASAVSSVTGSMAVAAPPSEVDDDIDDRSDTVGENGGERSDYDHYDDDTLDAPTASIVSASKDGPTLVDHVPRRPGSRPTDASILVVVDPSEVSTVGDMTYEEQAYGPVVDQMPPARPLTQAATEDSTAVAATSVGPDDTLVDTLVDDMDDVADADRPRDENESEGDDGATLPTLDNQPPMETNVVDHVPEEGPPLFGIDSVLTTAPTQSVLSPDETRDSDFGLVVDHLPTMRLPSPPSRGSMAVLAPSSALDDDMESGTLEEEVSIPAGETAGEQPASERTTEEDTKVVVDHLPPVRDSSMRMHPTDSTVTVRSHISDDDTLEAIARPDRFGPVVDQLPTAGASIQRSLGGSTTGALATLSEVNDDTIVDEDPPGWDYDEQELDSIQDSEREMGENGRQSRARSASRGLSVTFSSHETVKTVQNLDEGAGDDGLFTSIADETQYFDAELGDTPAKSVNETQESQYFDTESGEMMEDDADGSSLNQSAPLHINGGSRNIESPAQCSSCADAKGATCPCIQSILQANTDEDSMVISVMTPEGVPVEIDFKKLLQHETTKRLLLEKELEACRSTIGSMETSISQSEAKSIEDEHSVDEIRESTRVFTRELDSTREERDALASQNEELTALLTALRDKLSEKACAAEEYATRESAMQAEIEDLRRTREESRSESQQLAAMGDELASEVDQMRNANEELLMELGRQKGQCDALEAENRGLVDDCSSKERMLSDMTQEKSELSSRKSALEDEILQLRRALEESSLAATSETNLRNQLSSLQIEAATKSGECEELRTQVGNTQKKLQESEARNFAQMKESTRAKRLHGGEIQKLQEQLESLQKSKQAAVEEREANVRGLNVMLSGMESELQSLKSENESLKRTVNDARNKYEDVMRQERISSQEKISQMSALETKVKMLESEKTKVSSDLSSMRSQLQDSTEQANAAAALKDDYDSLQQTLAVNKETIQSLQEQVETLSQANKTGTDQMETLVASISSERDALRSTLQSKENEMQALQSELNVRSSEKTSLEDRLETLAAKCGELEASVEEFQSNSTERDALRSTLQSKENEMQAIQSELDVRSSEKTSLEDRLESLAAKCGELEASVEDLQSNAVNQELELAEKDRLCESLRASQVDVSLQETLAVNKETIQSLQEQVETLSQANKTGTDQMETLVASISSERDALRSTLQSKENEMQALQSELHVRSSEKTSLEDRLETLASKCGELEASVEEFQSNSTERDVLRSTLQSKKNEMQTLQSELDVRSSEKTSLEDRLESLAAKCGELEASVEDLQSNAVNQELELAEKDRLCESLRASQVDVSLQETLAVNKETIHSLQEQVETLSQANKTSTDQLETLVASISSERDTVRSTLQSKETELQALQSELHVRSSEKTSLEDRLESLAAKCGELEASVEDLQSNAVNQELELAEKDRLCESLRASQLDTNVSSQVREQYEREVADLNQLVSGNEKRLQLLQSQLEAQVNAIRGRDVTISELEQQRAVTEERVEAITRDRDNTLSRFKELDAELDRIREQQISLKGADKQQHEGRERELQESLDLLASERDSALSERELLDEDNEELLVQLGLVKQQLDAHESEAEELQMIAAEKEIAAKHAEERLREAEEYIAELSRTDDETRPQVNGAHESGQLAALEQTVDELTLAKEDLLQQVDDLSSTNAYIDAQVTSLRDEKVEMLGRLSELEQLKQTSGADTASREEQYQSRTRELEEQCRHLEELCKMKDKQLKQAMSRMHEAQGASASSQADINALQKQIAQIQNACAERDHALHDRERALEDLRLEMEGLRSLATASNAPRQSNADVDVDTLQRKLQHAERSTQHYQERLREMEAVLEQARKELKAKTEKLSETESTLFDRELELDLQTQDRGTTEGELQKQLHEMEALLAQRNHQIQEMFDRERSMEKTLGELQSDMMGTHSANGPSSSDAQPGDEEILQLRAQLSALQQQLQSSTSEHNEREGRARQEVIALNESIARKKEQIESLEKQLQSLSVEFSSSQDQLVSKEADFRRLSMELEETLGDQLQSTRTVTSQVLESSSKEQAESVDNMRSHIISLAQALERSETQRANAIERLLNERKASADSLRRLGESVKRFYSSLSYRDA